MLRAKVGFPDKLLPVVVVVVGNMSDTCSDIIKEVEPPWTTTTMIGYAAIAMTLSTPLKILAIAMEQVCSAVIREVDIVSLDTHARNEDMIDGIPEVR